MKQLYLLLAICLAFIKAEAQVIVGYEYFWDTDPGIDNATGTFGSTFIHADSVNITKTISTAGLSAGAHFLYIRTLDSDGKWSLSEGMAVNVVATIVDYEHFWDTDPGIGNGSGFFNLPFTHLDSVNITQSISTGALSAGVHHLFYRTRDSEGKWSLSEGMAVNVVPIIVDAEFFWDTDPGIDNGTGISVTSPSDSVNINILPSYLSTAGLSAGTHYFYVRTKDNFGKWSLSEGMAVNVVPIIVDAEFFWDTDPGIDNGTGISVTAPSDSVNINIQSTGLSTAGLSAGTHFIYVRTKDNFGKWSLSEGMAVNVVPIIVDAEFFWDTDPGIDNGTGISVTSPSDSVNINILPSYLSTAGLSAGTHYFYVRTKDNFGKWSLSEGMAVNVVPIIVDAEFFWDTDPGIDNGTGISVTAPSDSVNINIQSTGLSTAGLSAGTHFFYVRTKDNFGKWSLSEGMAVEVKPYLVKGEYFLNTDPGIGNGTIAFTAPVGSPADSINGSYNLNIGTLPYGTHYHYLRTMDNFGKWSLSEPRPFDVIMHITKVEYFFDTDPGVGLGIDIPITPDDTIMLTNLSIPITSLPSGWHNMYIRAKNNAELWTVIDNRSFYIQAALNPAYTTNTEIEYFIDTDPGVGTATNIPIADADTLLLNNQAIVTAGLSTGFHQLYLRAKNNAGVWSVIDSKPFVIDVLPPAVTSITQLEYFYDTDPGVGNAINLTLPGAPNDTVVINTNKIVPCLTNGTHFLWLRAKDNLGAWTVVDYDTLTVGGTMIAQAVKSLGPDSLCAPATVTMYADSAAGISYQWLENGTPISGATFAKYTTSVTGNFSLRQTCNASVVTSNIKSVYIFSSNIVLQPNISHVVCKGFNSGSISISPSGGIAPYSYVWNNGSTSAMFVNLFAGTYQVTVTDAIGCTKTGTYTVLQPASVLSISISKTTIRCGGASTGILTALPAGGGGTYSYLWNNGSTNANINTLPIGTYTVSVTDNNGCTKTKSVIMTGNSPILVTITPYGSSPNISLVSTVAGGVGPYNYVWNVMPSQTSATATGCIAGNTYRVKVTDSKGCTKIATIVLPFLRMSETVPEAILFPNPATNIVFVKSSEKINRIVVTDALGKKVYENQPQAEIFETQIDISPFNNGIYFVLINNYKTQKLIKQ